MLTRRPRRAARLPAHLSSTSPALNPSTGFLVSSAGEWGRRPTDQATLTQPTAMRPPAGPAALEAEAPGSPTGPHSAAALWCHPARPAPRPVCRLDGSFARPMEAHLLAVCAEEASPGRSCCGNLYPCCSSLTPGVSGGRVHRRQARLAGLQNCRWSGAAWSGRSIVYCRLLGAGFPPNISVWPNLGAGVSRGIQGFVESQCIAMLAWNFAVVRVVLNALWD